MEILITILIILGISALCGLAGFFLVFGWAWLTTLKRVDDSYQKTIKKI